MLPVIPKRSCYVPDAIKLVLPNCVGLEAIPAYPFDILKLAFSSDGCAEGCEIGIVLVRELRPSRRVSHCGLELWRNVRIIDTSRHNSKYEPIVLRLYSPTGIYTERFLTI